MSKISSALHVKLTKNPSNTFNVIVVLVDSKDTMPSPKFEKIMDGIYKAKLKSTKILNLAKNGNISSIEEDLDVTI